MCNKTLYLQALFLIAMDNIHITLFSQFWFPMKIIEMLLICCRKLVLINIVELLIILIKS